MYVSVPMVRMLAQAVSSTPSSPSRPLGVNSSSEQNSPHSNPVAMNVAYALIESTQRAIRSEQVVGPQTAHIPPALGESSLGLRWDAVAGASPLGRIHVSDEQSTHLAALNSAMARLPTSMDSERLR